MAVIISCANQKGGVGKSKLSLLLATFFHDLLREVDKKVIVLDMDYLQKSLLRRREREIEIEIDAIREKWENENGKGSFGQDEREAVTEQIIDNSFHIASTDFNNILNYMDTIIKEYDIIIVDFPGSIAVEGVQDFYAMIDYVFVVFNAGDDEEDSTEIFVENYNEKIRPLRASMNLPVNLYGVLNKVITSKLKGVYTDLSYRKLAASIEDGSFEKRYPQVKLINTIIPESKQIKNSVDTTSVVELRGLRSSNDYVKSFCQEVFDIINNDL